MFTKLQGESVKKLKQEGKYVYRFKNIVFNSSPTLCAPNRIGDLTDEYDFIFESKEDFDKWHRALTIEFALLDECVNYCKFFVRKKGNDGDYVREGKSFPVDGTWTKLHDFGSEKTKAFELFLKENNWYDNWFELMDRYK
jgi:hypothetical protein